MQVGKVSLWFSWGRKGKAEFTPPPFPHQSTCALLLSMCMCAFKTVFFKVGV